MSLNKKDWKIVYLNIVVILAFILAISLIFTFLLLDKQDLVILTGEICSPIILSSFAFWIWELKYLFKKGVSNETISKKN